MEYLNVLPAVENIKYACVSSYILFYVSKSRLLNYFARVL